MGTPVRALFGYVLLLFVVRLLPRRPGAQLTTFEFVVVFLIGGVIIRATVDGDVSVTNCGVAILTICLAHNLVAWLRGRSPTVAKIVDGTPLVLLERGTWRQDVMHAMHVAPQDVMAAARSKGLASIDEVKYAILERNGGISIVKTEP